MGTGLMLSRTGAARPFFRALQLNQCLYRDTPGGLDHLFTRLVFGRRAPVLLAYAVCAPGAGSGMLTPARSHRAPSASGVHAPRAVSTPSLPWAVRPVRRRSH